MKISGRVVVLRNDDIDTDVIAPTFWLNQGLGERNLETLRPHAFEAIRPGFDREVRPGDLLLTGKNFGAGSHREAALLLLKIWGIRALVSESVARIYFRNAIAAGFPAFNVPGVLSHFEEGETALVDMDEWVIANVDTGWSEPLVPFPPTVLRILDAGGIPALVKERLSSEGGGPR